MDQENHQKSNSSSLISYPLSSYDLTLSGNRKINNPNSTKKKNKLDSSNPLPTGNLLAIETIDSFIQNFIPGSFSNPNSGIKKTKITKSRKMNKGSNQMTKATKERDNHVVYEGLLLNLSSFSHTQVTPLEGRASLSEPLHR